MTGWAVDPNMPLELLNGAGMVVEFFFIGWMARYLWNETTRRKLTWRTWIAGHLPPSMNFAVSVIVFDIGVWVRSVDIWVWRRFYEATAFNGPMILILGVGAVAIILGSLCKVRSITKPDFGNMPWMVAATATALFVASAVIFR